jgi:hypothetical protein
MRRCNMRQRRLLIVQQDAEIQHYEYLFLHFTQEHAHKVSKHTYDSSCIQGLCQSRLRTTDHALS